MLTYNENYFVYNTQLVINALFDYSDTVVQCTETFLNAINCPKDTQRKIITVVEELFGNVSKYAFDDQNGVITIHCSYDQRKGSVTIEFHDQGAPFNPLESSEPDITEKLSTRKIGGLGIFIAKSLMDKMLYCYENNTNIVTIVKKIS